MSMLDDLLAQLDALDGREITVTTVTKVSSQNMDAEAIVAALKDHERRGNPVPWST